jgi:hypothetical protein
MRLFLTFEYDVPSELKMYSLKGNYIIGEVNGLAKRHTLPYPSPERAE